MPGKPDQCGDKMYEHEDIVDDDPIRDPAEWRPIIEHHARFLANDDPETFDLERIRREDPEMFHRITAKAHEFEELGTVPASVVRRHYDQLLGLFSQSYWRRRGFTADELLLNEYGSVRAILITTRHFPITEQPRVRIAALVNSWWSMDSDRGGDSAEVQSLKNLQ